jgi:hypothetical protein
MSVYLIDYDLKEGDDYTSVEEVIKKIDPTFWHHLDSTWIISTDRNATELTKQVRSAFPRDHGRLVILEIKPGADHKITGFDEATDQALKKKLFPKSTWDVMREMRDASSPNAPAGG